MKKIILILLVCLIFSSCGVNQAPQSSESIPVTETSTTLTLQKETTPTKLEDKVNADDINNWEHPVKLVLQQNSIEIKKLELTKDKTYPTFFVKFPEYFDEEYFIFKIVNEITKANAYWDYTLIDESRNIKIEVLNDKENRYVKSYIYNGTETDISEQRQYKKYTEFLNQSCKVEKLIKEDIDLDGKQEIIIAFQNDFGGIKSYVLRENGNSFQKLGEIETGVYRFYDVSLVRMRGSDKKYILSNIMNFADLELEGFALHEINKDTLDGIIFTASATGEGYSGLTSSKNDNIYDGFIEERYSYEVSYFGVCSFYKWNGKDFDYVSTTVETGDYPDTPENVVEQFLKLNVLYDEYKKSSGVINRLAEINISNKILNLDKIYESDQNIIDDWRTSAQTGSLEFDKKEYDNYVTVTVPVGDDEIIFNLQNKNNRWQITDIIGNFAMSKN